MVSSIPPSSPSPMAQHVHHTLLIITNNGSSVQKPVFVIVCLQVALAGVFTHDARTQITHIFELWNTLVLKENLKYIYHFEKS